VEYNSALTYKPSVVEYRASYSLHLIVAITLPYSDLKLNVAYQRDANTARWL